MQLSLLGAAQVLLVLVLLGHEKSPSDYLEAYPEVMQEQ